LWKKGLHDNIDACHFVVHDVHAVPVRAVHRGQLQVGLARRDLPRRVVVDYHVAHFEGLEKRGHCGLMAARADPHLADAPLPVAAMASLIFNAAAGVKRVRIFSPSTVFMGLQRGMERATAACRTGTIRRAGLYPTPSRGREPSWLHGTVPAGDEGTATPRV